MRYRRKLFRLRDPYDIEASQDLFLQAVRENCAYHYAHCGEYRAILEHFHFSPETLRCETDLARLPALPTAFFKGREIYSMPRGRQLVRATSSGTKGQMSRIGFDAGGLLCGLEMVVRIAQRHSLFSVRPAHYILLGYKPHRGNQTAVTKTAFGATLFTPALSRTYALRYGRQGYEPDLDGVVAAVRRHADSAFPLRFMGFPSYTYFMLQKMEEQGMRLRLHRGSKIMLGGGWKQFYRQQVDKRTLYALAEKVLGVGQENIVEFFGAVEHPILYCACPNQHFHVPVYSRVIIRDVRTLAPLPHGKPGLVNLITPMVGATPVVSVLTDDLGVLHDGASCGCGIESPYLELLGRVGLKEIKTCAAGAAELLTGVNG